jgi:serine protease Do
MTCKKSFFNVSFILIFSVLSLPVYTAENTGIDNLRQTSKAFSSIAKQVSPSVVYIQVESLQKSLPYGHPPLPFDDDMLERFFGERFFGKQFPEFMPPQEESGDKERRVQSQGSGFVFSIEKGVLSEKSYILTNNHVVEDAEKIRITFQDGREFDAQITGTDPKSDIAVLEIKDASHPALTMGDSAALEVGEWVVAMGNPFGLSHTLTVGVVSAKGRTGLGINDYEDFIQTDAAINIGNSGGPLLNLDGEVVGINTAIFSRNGSYMGVGFAIPATLVKNIARQLIEHGEVTRGYLGVVIQTMTPELSESFGIDINKGILISQVTENSPADKAGLKVGDLIVRYQDNEVSEVGDFRNRIALTPPGSEIKLTIIRNGKHQDVNVIVGNLDKAPALTKSSTESADELGIIVQTITPDLAKQFEARPGEGVVVTRVEQGSIAAMAGIRPGVVILQANKMPVNSAAEFKRAVEKSVNDKRVLLLISDRGMSRYVVLNWR